MKKNNVIKFEPGKRLLEKANEYVDHIDQFIRDRESAVLILKKALNIAGDELKKKIIMLLGGFAKEQIAMPLYEIMINPRESEEIRHAASIQLNVTASFLKDPRPLVDRLITALKSDDPVLRANAAFALGWEGNSRAAIPLIEMLYDPDVDVQQSAVNALSNLRDDRLLGLLLERLEHGPIEQKRCILYNLWRFYSKRDEVVKVYLEYLEQPDDYLRFDLGFRFVNIQNRASPWCTGICHNE